MKTYARFTFATISLFAFAAPLMGRKGKKNIKPKLTAAPKITAPVPKLAEPPKTPELIAPPPVHKAAEEEPTASYSVRSLAYTFVDHYTSEKLPFFLTAEQADLIKAELDKDLSLDNMVNAARNGVKDTVKNLELELKLPAGTYDKLWGKEAEEKQMPNDTVQFLFLKRSVDPAAFGYKPKARIIVPAAEEHEEM